MIDRQLLVSPEPPTTTGAVTTGTDSAYRCFVAFRGHEYQCYSAGKNTLIAGDIVSFWEIDGIFFCAKSSAGYPTRFKRPLVGWAATHAHNLFLQYCIRKQKNIFTYRIGVSLGAVDANTLAVACWDGIERSLPVEYAGVAKSSAPFVAGDAVALYRKSTGQYVVIGKAANPTITMTPASVGFGDASIGTSSAPAIMDVATEDLSADVAISSSAPFFISANGVTWVNSLTIDQTGGVFQARFTPSATGPAAGAITAASGDASDSVAVSGNGFIVTPLITVSSTFDVSGLPFNTRIPIVITHFNITTSSTIFVSADKLHLSETEAGPLVQEIVLGPLGTGTTTIYLSQSALISASSPQEFFLFFNAEGFLPFPSISRFVYFRNV